MSIPDFQVAVKCSDCSDVRDDLFACRQCGSIACQDCHDKRGCLACEMADRARLLTQWGAESSEHVRLLMRLKDGYIGREEFCIGLQGIAERLSE